MKKILSVVVLVLVFASSTMAAVTLRYENKDSKTHEMSVKIAGSSKSVEFGSSRTASVTIQGGSTEAVIVTSCGSVTVKDGDKVVIKDGCVKVQ